MKRAPLVLALLVIGCGGGWDKAPSATTCTDWLDKMSNDQRTDMAYAMQLGMWRNDNAVSEPSMDDAKHFADVIGRTCPDARSDTMDTVAAFLYITDESLQP